MAVALSERARIELAATGARPRRDALLSGPGNAYRKLEIQTRGELADALA